MSNSSAPGTRELVDATLVQARHGAPRFEELASRRQLVHAQHGAHCARALRVVALDVVAVSVFPDVKPTQQANRERNKEQQKTPSSRPKTCDASQPVESQPHTGAGGGARPQSPATAGQSRMPTGTTTASDRRWWCRSTPSTTRRCRRSTAAGAKPVEQQRESSRHRRGKRKPAVGTAWLDALAARRGVTGQPRAGHLEQKDTPQRERAGRHGGKGRRGAREWRGDRGPAGQLRRRRRHTSDTISCHLSPTRRPDIDCGPVAEQALPCMAAVSMSQSRDKAAGARVFYRGTEPPPPIGPFLPYRTFPNVCPPPQPAQRWCHFWEKCHIRV